MPPAAAARRRREREGRARPAVELGHDRPQRRGQQPLGVAERGVEQPPVAQRHGDRGGSPQRDRGSPAGRRQAGREHGGARERQQAARAGETSQSAGAAPPAARGPCSRRPAAASTTARRRCRARAAVPRAPRPPMPTGRTRAPTAAAGTARRGRGSRRRARPRAPRGQATLMRNSRNAVQQHRDEDARRRPALPTPRPGCAARRRSPRPARGPPPRCAAAAARRVASRCSRASSSRGAWPFARTRLQPLLQRLQRAGTLGPPRGLALVGERGRHRARRGAQRSGSVERRRVRPGARRRAVRASSRRRAARPRPGRVGVSRRRRRRRRRPGGGIGSVGGAGRRARSAAA